MAVVIVALEHISPVPICPKDYTRDSKELFDHYKTGHLEKRAKRVEEAVNSFNRWFGTSPVGEFLLSRIPMLTVSTQKCLKDSDIRK